MTIIDLKSATSAHLTEFKTIYEEAFPIDDEREDFDCILERTVKCISGVTTTIYFLVDDKNSVLGGIVFDIYQFSNYCDVEIIYITIDKRNRLSGLGTKLLQESTRMLRDDMEATGMPVRHMFLEVEKENESNEQTIKRMRFWRRNGAKMVPINYKQPPLSADKDWFCDMNLMVLGEETIIDDELKEFLVAFCHGLGYGGYDIEILTS